MRLTPRDIDIVRAVYDYRALTAAQIAVLCFGTYRNPATPVPSSRCQYRLKLLFQHGYLFRDTPPTRYVEGRKPLVYFPDRRAIALLSARFGMAQDEIGWHPRDNDVTWPFLEHLLSTNDVRIAVALACLRNRYTIHTWHDERQLKSAKMKDYVRLGGRKGNPYRTAIVPDGYFHLTDRRYHYHHFLEVDLATETVGIKGGRENRKTLSALKTCVPSLSGQGEALNFGSPHWIKSTPTPSCTSRFGL